MITAEYTTIKIRACMTITTKISMVTIIICVQWLNCHWDSWILIFWGSNKTNTPCINDTTDSIKIKQSQGWMVNYWNGFLTFNSDTKHQDQWHSGSNSQGLKLGASMTLSLFSCYYCHSSVCPQWWFVGWTNYIPLLLMVNINSIIVQRYIPVATGIITYITMTILYIQFLQWTKKLTFAHSHPHTGESHKN